MSNPAGIAVIPEVAPGDTITLRYVAGGAVLEVDAELESYDEETGVASIIARIPGAKKRTTFNDVPYRAIREAARRNVNDLMAPCWYLDGHDEVLVAADEGVEVFLRASEEERQGMLDDMTRADMAELFNGADGLALELDPKRTPREDMVTEVLAAAEDFEAAPSKGDDEGPVGADFLERFIGADNDARRAMLEESEATNKELRAAFEAVFGDALEFPKRPNRGQIVDAILAAAPQQ